MLVAQPDQAMRAIADDENLPAELRRAVASASHNTAWNSLRF